MKNINLQSNRVTDSTLHHAAEETAFGKNPPCWSVTSTDDQEHAETLGRVSISSTQTENRHWLQLNTLQKHSIFLPPLGTGKPQEGQKVSPDFFLPLSTKTHLMLKPFCQTSSLEARRDLADQPAVLCAPIFKACLPQHVLQHGKNASST